MTQTCFLPYPLSSALSAFINIIWVFVHISRVFCQIGFFSLLYSFPDISFWLEILSVFLDLIWKEKKQQKKTSLCLPLLGLWSSCALIYFYMTESVHSNSKEVWFQLVHERQQYWPRDSSKIPSVSHYPLDPTFCSLLTHNTSVRPSDVHIFTWMHWIWATARL